MQPRKSHIFPLVLLCTYIVLFAICAISPYDRQTWFVENLTVWIVVGALLTMYLRGIQMSNTSYAFMAVFIFMHTIGGHYTFERVPFDWFSDFFGYERNHYDRIAHFAVGFYAYPIIEWLYYKNLVANRFLLFTYPVFIIATIAMSYELVEWVYAAGYGGEEAANYLGSQGDIWDAQRDMLADTLGAISAVSAFFFIKRPGGGGVSSTSK